MFYLYYFISALLTLLTILAFFKAKDQQTQIMAGLVLLPFIWRLLLLS